jgi:molybdate transport system ATP-binding protein
MEQQEQVSFLQLSYGQQRLLLIARALVKHPTLLILDEPLQGLDSLNRHLVLQYIDRLTAHSHSQLLYVSHHAEDVPTCMTHRLQFIPVAEGGYRYETTRL